MSGPEVSFEEHERLALAMLAVEAGNLADVRDAMRKIVASAPGGTDVALLLSRALGHAEDRALLVAPPSFAPESQGRKPSASAAVYVRENHERMSSRWGLATAVALLGADTLFWRPRDLSLQTRVDGR